ncbi:MAG: bifunctional phosphoribosylaminoimidazolecarboxamide formyltransferase/IMP cyclohydrolase, partial [Candidatus Omnitrophica bacterium]|nr:bifunctional phosphoribosylaminoimidazolecarboxamide formyltransferase/IMP cyclohydrolase [Candidatus Omnitrophota bacterium]
MKIKRALISVSDKKGLESLAKGLDELGWEIISTGGTAKAISSLGIKVRDISSFTGFPEMMDGRVKTLHPKVHGGLLALRDNEEHLRQAEEYGIEFIDMVVVDLYPFASTVRKPGVTLEEAIENIDIGGPSMLRSAAKNYRSVAVVSSPDQYGKVLEELDKNGGEISVATKLELAVEAFGRTSAYDGMISSYLSGAASKETKGFPETLTFSYSKIKDLRYGENPHQRAAFYADADRSLSGLASAKQLGGKELSFNNLLDLNAAIGLVKEFAGPAAVVVKHGNPCGAAEAERLEQAYIDALDSDRLSAFGGIMGFNRNIGG